jgi:spore germination protein KC
MKHTLKAVVCALLAIAIPVSVSGCFDRRELDTLGIVMGVAIDKAEKDGDVKVTIQMSNPAGSEDKSGKSGSGGSEGESNPYINISGEGRNINYIVRELQHQMSRRIYVAHSQVLVISEDLAREGVRDRLDFFARAPEARMTVYMFVAKGSAANTLDQKPEFEELPSTELAKLLKDQMITSQVPLVTELDFVSRLISKTTGAVAPMAEIIEKDGRQLIEVSGCAVFKGDKMVGSFDKKQTRGYLFVENEVKTGVLLVAVHDATATVEIRKTKTKVKPVLYTDGTVAFDIDITATVGLGDQAGLFNLSDPDNVAQMLSAAGQAIHDEVQSAVDKSKELGSDVFGFGDYLNRKYPRQWMEMKDNWDALYKDVRVNINVNAKADGSGRIVKPLAPEGE